MGRPLTSNSSLTNWTCRRRFRERSRSDTRDVQTFRCFELCSWLRIWSPGVSFVTC